MTRKEAIQILADLIDSPFLHTWEKQNKALHMAIEALSEVRCNDCKWNDDVVEVVRCKDCRWWNCKNLNYQHNNHLCRYWSKFGSIDTSADDYCSYGERREE